LPNADFCIAIAPILDADPVHLMRLAGILPKRPPPVTNEDELLHLFRQIEPADRVKVLHALRGLVANGHHRPVPASLPAQTEHEQDVGNGTIHPHLEWLNRVSRLLTDEELKFVALRWARMVQIYENQIEADNAQTGERANASANNT
jgi:hypothetical protein